MTLECSLTMAYHVVNLSKQETGLQKGPTLLRNAKHQGTLTDSIIPMNNNSYPTMTHQVHDQLNAI